MNTEQKAKAYDEALEKAKAAFDMAADKDLVGGVVRTIFPELYESEDERIRKWLLECVENLSDGNFIAVSRQDVLFYLEKQKECVVDNNKTSAEEDERIRARLIEYFQGFLEGYEDCYKDGGCVKWEGLDVKSILAWLERQKENANSFTDGVIEVRSFQRGIEEGRRLEKKKLDKMIVVSPEVWDNAISDAYENGKKEGEKQKEQKHPNGCFTCDEYKKGYEEGRRNGFTAGYNKAMKEVEQKEQKPVVTLGETYHVDTLGTQQVIAGKMPQKPAEWDDYTKTNLGRAIQIIKDARGTLHGYQTDDGIYECDKAIEALEHFLYRGLEIEKSAEWSEEDENKIESIKGLITMGKFVDTNTIKTIWKLLDSLRPQPKVEWSEEDEKQFKRVLEIVDRHGTVPVFDGKVEKRFNAEYIWLKNLRERLKSSRSQPQRRDTYYDIIHGILDMLKGIDFTQITPEHRVSLLNDIRVKCKNADECAAILDEPSWKPSEEQMEALNRVRTLNPGLDALYQQLKNM